jgi:hypothetical protein
MSEDPETARQIAELPLGQRPLLVLDVDDVLLEFITPFMRFLDAQGLDMALEAPRLYGKITRRQTSEVVERALVASLLDGFFATQDRWQTPLADAVAAVSSLSADADVVLLTAMPHRHRALRRAHLDRLGFPYPLVTTETAKGPAVQQLRGATLRPVAFVDDTPHHLVSARAAIDDAHLFHLMAVPSLRQFLAPLPERIEIVDDWRDAETRIAAALRV